MKGRGRRETRKRIQQVKGRSRRPIKFRTKLRPATKLRPDTKLGPARHLSFHKTFSPLDGVDSADLASLVLWPSPFAAPRNHVGIHDARTPPRARRLTPQQCTTRRNRAVDGSHRRASWSEGYQTPNAHRNTSGVQIHLQTAPIPFARPSGGG